MTVGVDWKAEKKNLVWMVTVENLTDQEIAKRYGCCYRAARNARIRHVGKKAEKGRPPTRESIPTAQDAVVYRPRKLTSKAPSWSFWEHNL